ncbi:MAG: hypothetical protein L6R38_007978 [Xanthoria sp. 2 TBL-2021]|nr:MAG: hypothetical protein L6R38_007978 [Xanthoria sp. 2 TBL-2021]
MSAQNSKGIQTLLDAEREAQKIVQKARESEEDASQDAEEQVKAIRSAGDKQGQQVIDDLLRVVTDVRPEVPDRVAQPQA